MFNKNSEELDAQPLDFFKVIVCNLTLNINAYGSGFQRDKIVCLCFLKYYQSSNLSLLRSWMKFKHAEQMCHDASVIAVIASCTYDMVCLFIKFIFSLTQLQWYFQWIFLKKDYQHPTLLCWDLETLLYQVSWIAVYDC